MGRMPERTRLRAGEDEFDTESFVWKVALDIVTGGSGWQRVERCGKGDRGDSSEEMRRVENPIP